MTRRFSVAEPLSAIDEARRTGKALIVGDGEVFVLTRHVVVRREPPAQRIVRTADLSEPPPMSDADYRRISDEGAAARKAYLEATKHMECYDGSCSCAPSPRGRGDDA